MLSTCLMRAIKNATQSVFYENDNPILDPSQPIFEGLLPFEQTANPPRGIKKVCNQNMFNKKLVVSGRYLDPAMVDYLIMLIIMFIL